MDMAEEHPKLFKLIVGGILSLSIAAGLYMISALAIPEIKRQYAISRLDPKAVFIRRNPFHKDNVTGRSIHYMDVNGDDKWETTLLFIKNSYLKYGDIDGDGDYESLLYIRNSNGEYAKIPMRKGLDGKIEFLNLSAKAVNPLSVPGSLESSITSVDYKIDANGNYMSFLHKRNSDGTFVDIPLEKH